MKKTIQKFWNGHPYIVEIDFAIPSVKFKVEGSMPPLLGMFEVFALAFFKIELEPQGVDPKKIKWSYEIKTNTEIHSADVKLTAWVLTSFIDFEAVNVKVINR